MSKIYLASSWRNPHQPMIVEELRAEGHEVYDFRNPGHGEKGFAWSEIDPDWKEWAPAEYRAALEHPAAVHGLKLDFDAMKWADTIVALQPFGRSTALELGWGIGAGKRTALLLAPNQEPELMQGLADKLCVTFQELLTWLGQS